MPSKRRTPKRLPDGEKPMTKLQKAEHAVVEATVHGTRSRRAAVKHLIATLPRLEAVSGGTKAYKSLVARAETLLSRHRAFTVGDLYIDGGGWAFTQDEGGDWKVGHGHARNLLERILAKGGQS